VGSEKYVTPWHKKGGENIWEEGHVIIVVRKRTYLEERHVQMGILYAGIALAVDFLHHRVQRAHYVESL
jgi:hypothetical protein